MTRRQAIARLALRFWADEKAATSIEYALIASSIAVVIASTVFSLGNKMKDLYYNDVVNALP